MRMISILGTAAIFLALGGIEAQADNTYVHSSSRHAIVRHRAAPVADARKLKLTRKDRADWRAQYKDIQLNAQWNRSVDHKSVGLSDQP
jgi:hypothetical protein